MRLFSHRFRRLSLEGGVIVLGQVAAMLGSLTLVRVLTEFLTPAEYGILALALTLPTLVNQVVMAPITASVTRFFSVAKEAGDIGSYLSGVRRLLVIGSIVVALICSIGFVLAALAGLGEWLLISVLALISALVSGWSGALNGIQTAARQRAVVAFHVGLDTWLRVGLALFFLQWLDDALAAALVAYCLSTFVVMLSQLRFIRRVLPSEPTAEGRPAHWIGEMYRFGWPFSLWGLPTWLQMSSDRWSLQAFAPVQQVGAYAVLFQLGYMPISLLLGMATTFIAPIMYHRSGDGSDLGRVNNVRQLGGRITFVALTLTIVATVAAWLFHRPLFAIAVAEEFRSASSLLPWIVLAGGIFATGQMIAMQLMTEFRTQSLIYSKVGSAFLGVAANLAGAWLFGIKGVVAGLIAFSVSYLIWVLTILNNSQKQPAPVVVLPVGQMQK